MDFAIFHRLRELHLRNNRLSEMLELPVFMRQMRRLIVLDLRANPICSMAVYKTVIVNTFTILLNLDAQNLDPVEQVTWQICLQHPCLYYNVTQNITPGIP